MLDNYQRDKASASHNMFFCAVRVGFKEERGHQINLISVKMLDESHIVVVYCVSHSRLLSMFAL